MDVIYCQDCGAQNEIGPVDCRICGRTLLHEPSGTPCAACAGPVGEGASFCASCGAAVPVAVAAGRGERARATAAAVAPTDAGPVAATPTAADHTGAFGLGAGLDLPDWIKRAAAQTPHDPMAAVEIAPVPVGALAQPMAAVAPRPATAEHAPMRAAVDPPGDDRMLRERPASGAAVPTPEPSATRGEPALPPIPDGGLAATMPSWLRAPLPSADAGTAPPRTVDAAVAADPVPAAPPPDTRSFISEDDLPSWIRQLVAKEEADGEARRGAEATAAATGEAGGETTTATAAQGTRPNRGRLPIEPTPVVAASNAWLARGDRAANEPRRGIGTGRLREDVAAAAGHRESAGDRTSTFADVVERNPSAGGTGPLAWPAAGGAAPVPATNDEVAAAATDDTPAMRSILRNRRTLLLAALLLLVVVAAVLYLVNGGFAP